MEEQVRTERSEVTLYERGTPFIKVVTGVVGRFFPASVARFLGVLLAFDAFPAGQVLAYLIVVPYAGMFAAGFGIGLVGLSRFLFPDARVDGRRSVLAGLLAPLVVLVLPCSWVRPGSWVMA